MPGSAVGDVLAKAGIYALSSLALAACFGFMGATHQFRVSAAGPTSIELPQPLELPLPAPADELPPALAEPDVLDEARGLLVLDEDWQQLLPLPPDPNVPRLDAEALAAEVQRVGAMGIEMPETAPEYMGVFHHTAYCCEVYPHICGGNGVTASGTVPTPGLTCAADWSLLPPGTWLYIDGVGLRRVEDSGSAVKNMHLDIAVDTHANALAWRGFGAHEVWVLAWP